MSRPAWPGKDRPVEASGPIRRRWPASASPRSSTTTSGSSARSTSRRSSSATRSAGSSSSSSSTAGSGRPASRSTRPHRRACSPSSRRRSCRWAGSSSSRSAGGRSSAGATPSIATPSSTPCRPTSSGRSGMPRSCPTRAPLLPERLRDVRSLEPGAGRLREPGSRAALVHLGEADRATGHRPTDVPRPPGLAGTDGLPLVPGSDALADRPGRLAGGGAGLHRLDRVAGAQGVVPGQRRGWGCRRQGGVDAAEGSRFWRVQHRGSRSDLGIHLG